MTPTADQAIEILRRLPLPERNKVREWIDGNNEGGSDRSARLNQKHERFLSSMRWIDENREKYIGLWVALDGDRLLAAGADGKIVRAEAAKVSSVTPLMHLVTSTETEPFLGLD